jgi:hypothetical protein
VNAVDRIYRAICDESIYINRREHAEHIAQTVARALKSRAIRPLPKSKANGSDGRES